MRAVNDVGAIVQGAEQAAARGDHAGAERLLRQALSLQEANLGARHPDVANTLNNLAIVCEMTGNLVDAEACYRRAHAIATASLPPGDPFVAISRRNLEEFCAARGIPLMQTPPAPLPPPAPQAAPLPVKQAPPVPPRASSPVRSTAHTPTAPPATREPSRVTAIALGLAALVVLIAVGWFLVETNPQPVRSASAPEPAAVPPAAAPRADKPAASAPAPARAPSTEEAPAAVTRPSPVSVVSAQVCSSLTRTGAWTCTPAGAEQGPGTLYFYTRVASPTDTVVEHRWYRDGQLHQQVELNIAANPSGFRTYSRMTVTADHGGKWKVELRTPAGGVLHEETFAVR